MVAEREERRAAELHATKAGAGMGMKMASLVCHPEYVEGSRRNSAGGPLGQGRDGSTALTMTGGGPEQPTTVNLTDAFCTVLRCWIGSDLRAYGKIRVG